MAGCIAGCSLRYCFVEFHGVAEAQYWMEQNEVIGYLFSHISVSLYFFFVFCEIEVRHYSLQLMVASFTEMSQHGRYQLAYWLFSLLRCQPRESSNRLASCQLLLQSHINKLF